MATKSGRDLPNAKAQQLAPDAAVPAAGEKLQKVLARAGLGSRREMERWIEAGRVVVNGKVAHLGDRVDVHDQLAVDGRTIELVPAQEARCILYHKPPAAAQSQIGSLDFYWSPGF
mgnify:CR=1 FL=1